MQLVVAGTSPCPRAYRDDEPLRVTVVAPDPGVRRRLVDALASCAAIEVVGWAESTQALAVLDRSTEAGVVLTTAAQRRGAAPPCSRVELSPRQVDVLVNYASGNELLGVVARRMGIDEETVKTHLRRIRRKYADAGRPAPTRRDLYARAMEDGLLSPPC